jgi:hypothetical protein
VFAFLSLSTKFSLENFDDLPICERKLFEGRGRDLLPWNFSFNQGFSS